MDYEPIAKATDKMEKSLKSLNNELSNIRAGRANPKLLDKIMVDYYGTMTPIPQIGNLAVPEPRVLTISLWDASMMKAVEKAILASDIGITPSNDGKVIRLIFPEVTEERRKELVKVCRKYGEDTKVAMRSIRRDANDQIKRDKKASAITEDDAAQYEKKIQDLTDKYIKNIDDTIKVKEKEIMEV